MVDEQLPQWVNGRRAPPPCEIAPNAESVLSAEVRFGHAVRAVRQDPAGVVLWVQGPDGDRSQVRCHAAAGCEGSTSPVAAAMTEGRVSEQYRRPPERSALRPRPRLRGRGRRLIPATVESQPQNRQLWHRSRPGRRSAETRAIGSYVSCRDHGPSTLGDHPWPATVIAGRLVTCAVPMARG